MLFATTEPNDPIDLYNITGEFLFKAEAAGTHSDPEAFLGTIQLTVTGQVDSGDETYPDYYIAVITEDNAKAALTELEGSNSTPIELTFTGRVMINSSSYEEEESYYNFIRPTVTYTQSLNAEPLNAFNPQILKFEADAQGLSFTPEYATIQINSSPELNIPMSPNDDFYIDVSEIVKTLILTNEFKNLHELDSTTYVYNDTDLVLSADIDIKLIEGEMELAYPTITKIFVKGASQLEDYIKGNSIEGQTYKQIAANANEVPCYDYFVGYPFEIDFYVSAAVTHRWINRYDNYAGVDQDLDLTAGLNRITVSDGQDDMHTNGDLSIFEGLNAYSINTIGETVVEIDEFKIVKHSDKCGVYLKWYHSNVGWLSFLFQMYVDKTTSQSDGFINRTFDNYQTTQETIKELGKSRSKSITLIATNLTDEQMIVLESLIDSPQVYRYIAEPNTLDSTSNWISETIRAGSFEINNSRTFRNSISFELMLNPTNTLHL